MDANNMKAPLSNKSSLNYRPDIDGLRAVAVLSVLACHIKLPRMAGGFVGVDVFFVISGYLISSIVFAEIAASRFSILSFYERRIRRIFPALFAMLPAFSVFATIYFLPVELVSYCKSLLAATVSSSNFYFWQHSGYFDSPTSNPLLHTWSLAVEEQFYILFPIFLVTVRKFFPQRLRTAVVSLFIVSFVVSAIVVSFDRNTAFYMPYTRAWELLMGTMLSLRMFPRLRSAWLRNLAVIFGTAMIVWPVFSYSKTTLFPGLSAFIPCMGSALIIGAGESGSSLVGSLLSFRPVVFIGLISYSLYLWHWPVIILHEMGILLAMGSTLPHQYATLLTVRRYDWIIEISLSLMLAVLSWRFVERPFRNGSLRLTGRPLFILAGAGMFTFSAYSLSAMLAGGFKGRFSPDSVQLASYLDNTEDRMTTREGACFITSAYNFKDYDYRLCLHREAAKSNFLLLGDSHSAVLWKALSSAFPGANIMQANTSGCGPFVHASNGPDCEKMMKYIYQDYLLKQPIQGLLLEKRWAAKDIGELTRTVEWANQHRVPVILFGPVPEYDAPLPRLEAYSLAWNQPDLASEHRVDGFERMDRQLQSLSANWHIPYVSLYQAICSNESCTLYSDSEHKVPLMFDTDHLSPAGSSLIVHRLIDRGELSLNGNASAM